MKIITYTLLFVVFASSNSVYSINNKTTESEKKEKDNQVYQLKLQEQKKRIIDKQQGISAPSLEKLRNLQENRKKFNLED